MTFVRRAMTVAGLGAALFAMGCGTAARIEADEVKGEKLFTLKDVDGNSVSLEKELAAHKAVLINFWATWCPPCREEIPDLIKLQSQFSGRGFTILGVDVGESEQRVKTFAKKAGLNYPLLLDSEKEVATKYNVVGIPTSYLVASDGKILGEYHAATPQLFDDVEKAVSA